MDYQTMRGLFFAAPDQERPAPPASAQRSPARQLLAGEEADTTGDTVTTRGRVSVPGCVAPPVYVAAMGPQMTSHSSATRKSSPLSWRTSRLPGWRSSAPTSSLRLPRAATASARSCSDTPPR